MSVICVRECFLCGFQAELNYPEDWNGDPARDPQELSVHLRECVSHGVELVPRKQAVVLALVLRAGSSRAVRCGFSSTVTPCKAAACIAGPCAHGYPFAVDPEGKVACREP